MHRVKPRYVQRLFESEGTTFTDYVLTQRLAFARRLLSDPFRAGVKISAIALDAGFGDLSYFNRTFRRRYGMTPSELRAAETSQQHRLTSRSMRAARLFDELEDAELTDDQGRALSAKTRFPCARGERIARTPAVRAIGNKLHPAPVEAVKARGLKRGQSDCQLAGDFH